MSYEQNNSIAVVVSVHAPYLRYVMDAVSSVENQATAVLEKWLCCDGCPPPEELPSDWLVVRGDWKSPSPGRNEVLQKTKARWLVFLDGDDMLERQYTTVVRTLFPHVSPTVAVLYPDICMFNSSRLVGYTWPTTPWTPEDLGWRNFVPTPSCWRKDALDSVNGWADKQGLAMDDWATMLALYSIGWVAKPMSQILVYVRRHEDNFSVAVPPGSREERAWRSRRMAVVTLFSGREDVLPMGLEWMKGSNFPPQTEFWLLDDSGRPEFYDRLYCELCAPGAGFPYPVHLYRPGPTEHLPPAPYNRNARVARLYAPLIPKALATSDVVLVREDDVKPPDGGVRKLSNSMDICGATRLGGVAGVYCCRGGQGRLVSLSESPDVWLSNFPLERVEPGAHDISMIPGGFTLYLSAALRQCLPIRYTFDTPGGLPSGWDGNVSRDLRRNLWLVRYNGDVRCEHWPLEDGVVRRYVC